MEETPERYLKGLKEMKMIGKFKWLVEYKLYHSILKAWTGYKGDDDIALVEAAVAKMDRLGIPHRDFGIEELKKERDRLFGNPQKKTVRAKVRVDPAFYYFCCVYAGQKETRCYIEKGDIEGLSLMIDRKQRELQDAIDAYNDFVNSDPDAESGA